MAYNVHGLENKFFHPDFYAFIEQNDVFILIETHVEEKNIVNYKNRFRTFDTIWIPATRNSIYGRAIGGIVCGIKKDLVETGVKYEFKSIGNMVVILISTSISDFAIYPVYLRSANWENDFEELKRAINIISAPNPIVIGDLNIRIGEEQQLLDENILATFPAGLINRQSNDKTCNSKGRRYIDYCNDQGLVILNGRTKGDVEGHCTYVSTIGTSVNDICAVAIGNLEVVQHFEVGEVIWSDHLPINLKLSINKAKTNRQKMNLLPKLKWNHNSETEYKLRLDENLKKIQNKGKEICINDLRDVILNSYKIPSINKIENQGKNPWFDKKCKLARDKSMKFLNIYRISQNEEDRGMYLKYKQEFNKLCNKKRIEYYNHLEIKLNTVHDSKRWWALVREVRNQENHIGDQVTAENFRQYFNDLLNPVTRAAEIYYAAIFIRDENLDKEFTISEIKQQLARAKTNKAPGEDRIPYEFFVHATDEYLKTLASVYTNLLSGKGSYQVFQKSVIFPIHKKGDANQPGNYRGISFMNCIGKIMMGMVNNRITEWVNRNRILNEYQAGFRKYYSTIDNIYNLTNIVQSKFADNRKVYAFFIDFKAAFDRVPRNLLIYKLHQMGLSTKILNFIEKVYQKTTSAVWTGAALSTAFETKSGVKQGCLLSPLLFALYLNDLHDFLEGGLFIEELNIRVLMYADDIVMLADDVGVLQQMSNKLEEYCRTWGMEVNLEKSEILIFRKGGRISKEERWTLNGSNVKVVPEYKYLGIVLTPKMSFSKHVSYKNYAAKVSLNATWKDFVGKKGVSLRAKWKIFTAVTRAVQAYGAQVWGNSWFEEVDKLQRYFIKRILRLPDNIPNYVLSLETAQEDSHFYTYGLHLKYVAKTCFNYGTWRLPYKLSQKVIAKNIGWYKDFQNKLEEYHVNINDVLQSKEVWNSACITLFERMKNRIFNQHMESAQKSVDRIYKQLDLNKGITYCIDIYNQEQIAYIMRARGDCLWLNGNQYRDETARKCSLCNMREIENTRHFVGRCPILRTIRSCFLHKQYLTDDEIVYVLNGGENSDWLGLYKFIKNALKYRSTLVYEFNY